MKTRSPRPSRPAVSTRSASFALHPLSLASLIALAGPALALPQGAVVVSGKATVTKPTSTTQVVTQSTDKAIIDWTSFSIAAGEKVRFDQPTSSAVILNRVTGYDPSKIFGSLEANGRVFLLNPYGVVFGASARVDVGGLVASSLSLSNADFNAGRLRLTSNDGSGLAIRGEVRNEGLISAPGGTVVLAGPSVSNSGVIEARNGRVGMAAVQDVLVDVEGDGLIFFQASATDAGNRLAQLGRIQADGGSVELRAAARGAFADTVLNMSGVVQARAIGTREGRIVIDGGESGITRVAGALDASGASAGEHGGAISVRGQKVLLDLAAVLNASGDAGGGTATVGGNWQGEGGGNAEMTHVARGARIDVSATSSGDGGTAVVWSDQNTRYLGDIAARGGADGGNGGKVEVSGKAYLAFEGDVDLAAPVGRAGSLLLDPSDIHITTGTNSVDLTDTTAPFDVLGVNATSILNVGTLTNLLRSTAGGGDVIVNATAGSGGAGSISVDTAVTWNSQHSLTLLGSGAIDANAAITNNGNGNLNLFTSGAVTLNSPVTLNGGTFTVAGTAGAGSRAASLTTGASGTITTTPNAAGVNGGNVNIATSGDITLGAAITTATTVAVADTAGGKGGDVSLTTTDGGIVAQAITTSGINNIAGGGPSMNSGTTRRGGNAGSVTLQVSAATSDRAIDVQGQILANGGSGGAGSGNNDDGGDGGTGGAVLISTSQGAVTTLGINASGGTGGNGAANNTDGGTGGAAGTITVTAAGNLAARDGQRHAQRPRRRRRERRSVQWHAGGRRRRQHRRRDLWRRRSDDRRRDHRRGQSRDREYGRGSRRQPRHHGVGGYEPRPDRCA